MRFTSNRHLISTNIAFYCKLYSENTQARCFFKKVHDTKQPHIDTITSPNITFWHYTKRAPRSKKHTKSVCHSNNFFRFCPYTVSMHKICISKRSLVCTQNKRCLRCKEALFASKRSLVCKPTYFTFKKLHFLWTTPLIESSNGRHNCQPRTTKREFIDANLFRQQIPFSVFSMRMPILHARASALPIIPTQFRPMSDYQWVSLSLGFLSGNRLYL